MKEFSTRITIEAPAARIWSLLTDGPGYTSWNTTVDRVDGTIAPGQTIRVFVKINPGRAFPVKVTTFDAPTTMVWTGGMPLGLFRGERTFTSTPTANGSVDFAMREVYTGLLAPLITKSIPDLQPAFDELARALKMRAERKP